MMIDIAEAFSPYPSGRVAADGDKNGTEFRQNFLLPAVNRILAGDSGEDEIIVNIDGVRSFGSSFLEEAFGGLAREQDLDVKKAVSLLKIQCTKPHLQMYRDAIKQHLEDALSGKSQAKFA